MYYLLITCSPIPHELLEFLFLLYPILYTHL